MTKSFYDFNVDNWIGYCQQSISDKVDDQTIIDEMSQHNVPEQVAKAILWHSKGLPFPLKNPDHEAKAAEYSELIIGGAGYTQMRAWLRAEGYASCWLIEDIMQRAHQIADDKRGVVPW